MKKILFLCVLLSSFSLCIAKEAQPLADDVAIEKRMITISEELRCLVCQNESLAGSRAELAQDLRRELRELIRSGKSDEEIKTYLVDRYGDFVLYRPPMKSITWLLWLGPFVLLIAGILGLLLFLRRRQLTITSRTLSAEENQRIETLLQGNQHD